MAAANDALQISRISDGGFRLFTLSRFVFRFIFRSPRKTFGIAMLQQLHGELIRYIQGFARLIGFALMMNRLDDAHFQMLTSCVRCAAWFAIPARTAGRPGHAMPSMPEQPG